MRREGDPGGSPSSRSVRCEGLHRGKEWSTVAAARTPLSTPGCTAEGLPASVSWEVQGGSPCEASFGGFVRALAGPSGGPSRQML